MLEFINEYRIIVGTVLTLLITVMAIKFWWDKISLFILNITYSLPLIGLTARLAKDHESVIDKNSQKWFASEDRLCSDYAEHYSKADKDADYFIKCQDYLRKVGENGRNELHLFGWIIIAALVFLEAMGFSYVLSGYTIQGASENIQQIGAMGIAFIVSVLLVTLTHASGQEIHYNSLIKKAKEWYRQDASRNEKIPDLRQDTTIDLVNNNDSEQPQWQQMINRLNVNYNVTPKHTMLIVTIIFTIAVACGSTYIRGKVLEKNQSEDHQFSSQLETLNQSAEAYDPYATQVKLPPELEDIQNKANKQATEDATKSDTQAAWATFIVLAVIFVFLQILGVFIGFKTGFVGKESSVARKSIGKFKTKEQYDNFYARIKQSMARNAQAKLVNLQQRLAQRSSKLGTNQAVMKLSRDTANRSFLSYINLTQIHEAHHDFQTEKLDTTKNFRMEELQKENTTINLKKETIEIKEESPEEMEARIRAEITADLKAASADKITKQESEAEMRARIAREMQAEMEGIN